MNYRRTVRACFVGYIVQAIINNLAPLLFLTFQSQYGIPLSKVTLLITINFCLQLTVDCASVYFIDRIGYRASALLAHSFSAIGLIMLSVLPRVLPDPYVGLLCAVCFYAVGGGLLEVIISPMVEACPTENKARTMSILHSFYCWGSAAVIVLSTLFLKAFGTASWQILAPLWAILPIANGIVFLKTPIAPLIAEGEEGLKPRALLSSRTFWLLAVLMVCAGACEHGVSEWASSFAEKGLGISKVMGDLAGPTIFALMMGTSRAIYGRLLHRFRLRTMMLFCGALCAIAYLMVGLIPNPAAGLLGMALCGFAVGIMWPGTFSIAAAEIRNGGTAMFALLALAGDLGCASGPTLAGMVAGMANDSLRIGILSSGIIPHPIDRRASAAGPGKGINRGPLRLVRSGPFLLNSHSAFAFESGTAP